MRKGGEKMNGRMACPPCELHHGVGEERCNGFAALQRRLLAAAAALIVRRC